LNRYPHSISASFAIAFMFALIVVAGCSEDEVTPTPPQTGALDLDGILCNPLAPAPGDTALLTVRAEGQGTGATYEWSADGGTLVEDSGISIKWATPTDPGIYMVTVRAASGSVVKLDTVWVMVRNCEAIDTGMRYSFYPYLIDGELFFVGTAGNPTDRSFLGYHAYKNAIPPTQIDKLTTPVIGGGYEFQFCLDGLITSSITDGAEYLRLQPMNVIYFPYLPALPKKYWSNNEAAGTTYRKNQNAYPSMSASLETAVWQRTVVGATDDGKKDLVNIRFRFSTGQIQTLTTAKDSIYQLGAWNYTYWRNIRPMISPDETMIIYFCDSTDTFEPCVIPINGAEPDLDGRRAFMVDDRRGIFYYAGVAVSEKTIFQWNPLNQTQVAFIDDKRQFCVLDYGTEQVEVMAEGIDEFVFSEDGKIAAVAEDGVYVLEPGQTEAKRVFTKERLTDAVIGVNWSPGTTNLRLGFRMVRKGASTVESYAALVIYSMDDDRWYYASPEIKPVMSMETEVSYLWKRALFNLMSDELFVPVFLSTGGGEAVIYRSY
jgi:PKD repeat protein